MTNKKKIGIISHENFAFLHDPPYPRPIFSSYENPLRIKAILDYFDKIDLLSSDQIVKIIPETVSEEVLRLTHSAYHVNLIKRLSLYGSGVMGEEIFITEDTFELAKLAVGGSIEAMKTVINGEVEQSIALIRPPGHHATRDKSSGLCIFNNIATAIQYLRTKLNFNKKIAIIDIDDHFGDGLAQYFYEDPNVLYFSIHEYDFIEGDIGHFSELGEGEGLGTNINFPVPLGITDEDFLDCISMVPPILKQFKPELIIIAMGFDFHFSDPIGNGFLTTSSYYHFASLVKEVAEEICNGKVCFILEGGYGLQALPFCVHSIIRALLNQEQLSPSFEFLNFSEFSKKDEILKISALLKHQLSNYWNFNSE